MNPVVPCPGCGCREATGATPHAVIAALAQGDIDRAIEAGMLDCLLCVGCGPACTAGLLSARDARLAAWAGRERYRARQQRLQRRAAELAATRAPGGSVTATEAVLSRPALPAAAAAVLARAKAKAAERPET